MEPEFIRYVTIKTDGPTWSVFDRVLQQTLIVGESYVVASNVADAFNHPERWRPSEAYEIAAGRSPFA